MRDVLPVQGNGYAASMAAAPPSVDAPAPSHSLAALKHLAAAVRGADDA
ncbi:hypothetical protein OHT76_40140 [Streptomyces sp. NBC_00287]|nr:hypothetical protein [Streptomyces sp. NBC_00287]